MKRQDYGDHDRFWGYELFGRTKKASESFVVVISLVLILFATLNMYPDNRSKVICFGDSITHGAKVDGHSWVYFLSRMSRDVDFVNEGRNGRKTSDREEILSVLRRYPCADCFIIFLGVNDLKDGNDSMVNQCVANVKWMIDRVHESCEYAKTVVLSPPEINLARMSKLNVGKKYNQNTERSLIVLDEKYEKFSLSDSAGFVSLLKAVSPENYVDGLHPNEAGQRQIAQVVWTGIENLLRHVETIKSEQQKMKNKEERTL